MSSVALDAGASAPTLSAEAHLARRAARADREAFEELYRRHSQTAWRLAQAVARTPEGAADAVTDGFVRAVREMRRRQSGAEFRPVLMASVYRSAIDQARRSGKALAPSPTLSAADPDEVIVAAAFRSLPERWRAAVWLSEVEGLGPDEVAGVLGVSSAVAAQLIARGRRGLDARLEQARRKGPRHLGPMLRPLASTVPAGLAEAVEEGWHKAVATDPSRFLPFSTWLNEKAVKPLSLACIGLLALGIVGAGVLTQDTSLPGGPPVAANHFAGGTGPGVTTPGGSSGFGLGGPSGGAGSSQFLLGAGGGLGAGLGSGGSFASGGGSSGSTSGSGASLSTGGSGGSTGGSGGSTGGSGGSTGGSGGSGNSTGGTPPSGGQSPGGGQQPGGGSYPPPGSPGTTSTTLPGGLGSLSIGQNGLSANVAPGVGGGASVGAGTGGLCVNLLGQQVTCSTSTTSSSSSSTTTTTTVPSTTTTTSPLSSLTSTVSSLLP